MIGEIIIIIIAVVLLYLFARKQYKQGETFFEKVMVILYFLIGLFPLGIIFLDGINILSILKLGDKVEGKIWLELLFNYGALIIGQIFSAIILFFITRMQIDAAREENYERDKTERRLNNMPLLEYSFIDTMASNVYELNTKSRAKATRYLGLRIDNIGDSAVRKCFVQIKSNILKKDYIFKLDEQSCLPSGKDKLIAFDMKLNEGIYKYSIVIYYQDIIHNWYSQEILLEYTTTEYHVNSTLVYPASIKKCEILDEVYLEETPILEFDN